MSRVSEQHYRAVTGSAQALTLTASAATTATNPVPVSVNQLRIAVAQSSTPFIVLVASGAAASATNGYPVASGTNAIVRCGPGETVSVYSTGAGSAYISWATV